MLFVDSMENKGVTMLEQFAERVTGCSSRYNSEFTMLYAPENVVGKPSKYPSYGDFHDTYMLRTYGKWWHESEAAQPTYMTQDIDPIISEDYLSVSFEYAVVPKSIIIYETYNPGAIVRIWGRNMRHKWILLWEFPVIRCLRSSNVFTPSIKKIQEVIKEVRIDFNQSLLHYHTAIDAILLAGYLPKSLLQANLLNSGVFEKCLVQNHTVTEIQEYEDKTDCDYFSKLPVRFQ